MLDRVVSGDSQQQTFRDDATERGLARVLPEWLRGSKLLDNDGEHYTTSSGTEIKIEHGLGRQHRGFFLVNKRFTGATATSNGERGVFEDPDDTFFDTFLNLQCASGTRYEYTFDVVVY